jgi:hypothetical protein
MENAKLMEIIQQKIAEDDADSGWALAAVGLMIVERLEWIQCSLNGEGWQGTSLSEMLAKLAGAADEWIYDWRKRKNQAEAEAYLEQKGKKR